MGDFDDDNAFDTGSFDENSFDMGDDAPVEPAIPGGALFQSVGRSLNKSLLYRRSARGLILFKDLAAAPADMGDLVVGASTPPLVLPGGARLALSCSAILAAGDITVFVGPSRAFTHVATPINIIRRGVYGEKGQDLVVRRNLGNSGTLTIYIVDLFGRHHPIATVELLPL